MPTSLRRRKLPELRLKKIGYKPSRTKKKGKRSSRRLKISAGFKRNKSSRRRLRRPKRKLKKLKRG